MKLLKRKKIYHPSHCDNILKPDLKKIKVSNSIVVGGMIAFGKSTLAKMLHDVIENSNIVYELNDEDQLMHLLLEKMYERENNTLYGSVFQLYFVLNRFDNYKNGCNNKKITIFDRSIFEDWLFAHENIIRPSVFSYYDSLWKDVATELIYEYGVPKLYVILTGDWKLFKERLFKRDRKIEIENFEKNEVYFKKLLQIYEDYMINVCKDFGIDYIVVDASQTPEAILEIVLKKMNTITEWQSAMTNFEIKKIENFTATNQLSTKKLNLSTANNITKMMQKFLHVNELTILQMLNGLGPYSSKKDYAEICIETNFSMNKVKLLEKNGLKKLKPLIQNF